MRIVGFRANGAQGPFDRAQVSGFAQTHEHVEQRRYFTGASEFLALACVCTALPALAGIAVTLRREDALVAAGELDRRAGLDGLLATGLEISRGGIRSALAPLALRRAETAARSLDGSEIPVAPPAWARYLSLPGALLVAILALPEAGRVGRGAFPAEGTIAAGKADTGSPDRAAGRTSDEARETRRREIRQAVAAYKAAHRREADRTKEATRLPAAPPIRSRPKKAGEGEAARSKAEGAAPGSGADGGAGEGEAPASPEDAGSGHLGGARAGPVDLEEAALFRERFPEYEGLIRRYFTGR